ncbi:MAG: AraC family transcriptional regulator [Candidatus Neoclostridium sp.]
MIPLSESNPFLRAAEIQPAILEGNSPRMAYDYRLFYILKGNGEIFLSGQTVPLEQDALVCFPPQTEYFFRGRLTVVVLNFDMTRSQCSRTKPLMPPQSKFFRSELMFDATVAEGFDKEIILQNAFFLRGILCDIVREFSLREDFGDVICSASLKQALALIRKNVCAVRNRNTELVEKLKFYVKTNAAAIKSNGDLGETFGYHPVYLASVFKSETGKSLHRSILEQKIALACKYLQQTEHSIEQIAEDSGFSSRNHFCTIFSQIIGLSPSAWRKKFVNNAALANTF